MKPLAVNNLAVRLGAKTIMEKIGFDLAENETQKLGFLYKDATRNSNSRVISTGV